jgi:hypothetical protein
MKKVVKLTESDLKRIVKRVMNEGVIVTAEPIGTVSALPQGVAQGTWKLEGNNLHIFADNGGQLGHYTKG